MSNYFDKFDSAANAAKDLGTSFAIGSNSLLKMGGDLYGLIFDDRENRVSQQAQENIEYLQRGKSAGLTEAEQARKRAVDAEDGWLNKAAVYIKETVKDPSLIANASVEALPSMVGSGGAGAVARGAATKLLARKGAEKAAELGAKIGVGTAVGSGAVMQGASVGADAWDDVVKKLNEMPEEQAAAIPQISYLMREKELTLPQAKAAVALDIARSSGILGAVISAGSQMIPGGQSIEKMLVGGAEKAAGKSLGGIAGRIAGAAKSGVGEMAQEAIEEGGGRYIQNVEARQVDPNRQLSEGVGEAVGGAVVGVGPMGAASGLVHGRPSRTPQPVSVDEQTAGMSGESPTSAATRQSVTEVQKPGLEKTEGLSEDQFWAIMRVRHANLIGAKPNPEDIALVGNIPAPKIDFDPKVAERRIQENQETLDRWAEGREGVPTTFSVIYDPNMKHNGFGVRGAINTKTGEILINAAFTPVNEVAEVANHEWAHHTLMTEEGKAALANFAQNILPESELKSLSEKYGVPTDTPENVLRLVDEWVANNEEKSRDFLDKLVGMIREWLAKYKLVDLRPDEVARVMLRTLRESDTGKIQPNTTEETKYSLSKERAESPEFIKQFRGTVASDKNGMPIKYYHGTPAAFEGNIFKPSERVNRSGNVSGYYFTPDPEEASWYTGQERWDEKTGDSSTVYQKGAQILPVYLAIRNPFVRGQSYVTKAMLEAYRKELAEANPWIKSESWFNEKLQAFKDRRETSANALNGDGDAAQRILKAGGYDGYQDGRHLVAFDSSQVKSATGNVGSYGQRPVTKEEAARYGMTADEANAARRKGDFRFSLTREKPEGTEPFYSQLSRTLLATPEKATRGQIEAALREGVKAKGQLVERPVKAEEMADVKDEEGRSFAEWLKENPEATRQQMIDFADKNRVKLDEVILGGEPTKYRIVDRSGHTLETFEDPEQAQRALKAREAEEQAKYQIKTQRDRKATGFDNSVTLISPTGEFLGGFFYNDGDEFSQFVGPRKEFQGRFNLDYLRDNPQAMTQELERVRNMYVDGALGLNIEEDSAENAPQYQSWSSQKDRARNYREAILRSPGLGSGPYMDYRGHFDRRRLQEKTRDAFSHVRYSERETPDGKNVFFGEEIQSDLHQNARRKTGPEEDSPRVGYRDPKYRQKLAELQTVADKIHDQIYQVDNRLNDLVDEYVNGERTFERREKYLTQSTELKVELQNLRNQLNGLTDRQLEAEKGLPDAPFKSSWPELSFKYLLNKAIASGAEYFGWTTGDQQNERYLKGLPDGGHGMRQFYDVGLPRFADKYLKKFGVKTEPLDVVREPARKDVSPIAGDFDLVDMPATTETVHAVKITPEMRKELGAGGQTLYSLTENKPLTVEEANKGLEDGSIQFSLTRLKSPEFLGFFGDWPNNPEGASKVVDESGRPRIVFHGTTAGTDFTVFKTHESQGGAHFAIIPAVASSFARIPDYNPDAGARVIPVYLDIRNPWRARDLLDWSSTAVIKEWAAQHGISKAKAEQEFNDAVGAENAYSENDTRQVQIFLKSKGYDGIVYVNRHELYGPGEETIPAVRWALAQQLKNTATDEEFLRQIPEASDAWIAFDPEQIKSATGNVGSYGQRPVTSEEAERTGRGELTANVLQRRGDISYSLTEKKAPLASEPVEEVSKGQSAESDEDEESIDTTSKLGVSAKRERDELPPTSALNTLYAKNSSVPLPLQGKRTNGQVAEQLRQAAREHWGREITAADIRPEEIDRIVDNAVEEVIAGLKASNHAGNWYTTAIRKAMAIARVLHPELGDDTLAQKAGFKDAHAAEIGLAMAMAITSQNLNVEKNTEYANEQFNILKQTGRFDPSKGYGSKKEAISGNLELANTLLDRVGWDGIEEFLNREYTVKELSEIASEVLGKKASITGKVDDIVNGSAIFGPKIGGGFFQNLRANFNPVTVDLWMRRTWGRWTGDVLPEPLDANRLARMLVGMRDSGIQLPEELRSIRTVIAEKGRKVPTLTEKTAAKILSDPEAITAAYDFAAQNDSRWNKIYSEVRQPITPEQAEAVRNGSLSLEKLNRQQQKSIREKQEAWQKLEDRPPISSKEGKEAQKALFAQMDEAAGRTAVLTNEELSQFKPEWAKASRVVTTLLKPVDVPSDIDRRVIVDVVNRVRSELDRRGINATNADIQAILWYPEKDLWAKLAGKPESKLKNSYDEEFLRVAEAQGLGEQARNAAKAVRD